MHSINITLFISILFFSNTLLSQSNLEKAEQFFEKRSEIVEDGKANSENIDKAIEYYKLSNQEPEKTVGLLKSWEYKASWTNVSQEEQKELYNKAIELAKNKSADYPENSAIAYWHAANYARWADLIDITRAAEEGVLNEIKELSEKAIKLDENYNQAGALRLLGGLHLEAPNIPLIITWPSNDEAYRLLKKAYEIAPQHPANVYLYAKVLHELEKDEKAKEILNDLIKREERESYFLVDQKYIQKGQEYFNDNF
ncbi:tetratricopeptide repeat protein [Marivirga salinae]|uniref:Tetratricopeptide repeat protein n=1 Tax=Marivirga salinarum TaxID=3059078 RepID=A0AA49GC91_9BACT|nr:tetratricopeptide repeat protein [Marivirga sp. BDSF4-3]WKK75853.2 tetratricopeptide repeat protein [Marivirga sp. BDSF4-3]